MLLQAVPVRFRLIFGAEVAAAARDHVAPTDGKAGSGMPAKGYGAESVHGVRRGRCVVAIAQAEVLAARDGERTGETGVVVNGNAGADAKAAVEGIPVKADICRAQVDLAFEADAVNVIAGVVDGKASTAAEVEMLCERRGQVNTDAGNARFELNADGGEGMDARRRLLDCGVITNPCMQGRRAEVGCGDCVRRRRR
jgi:hypothetical protein